MNCKWVSNEDRNLRCNRHADSSGYCLFHKKIKIKGKEPCLMHI